MKKTLCRMLSLLTVAALMLSLCACGKAENAPVIETDSQGNVEKQVWYMGGESILGEDIEPESVLGDYTDTIDPSKIYASLTVTADMLYGVYALNNQEKDLETVRSEIPFEDVAFESGTNNVTILPTAVYMGAPFVSTVATGYRYGEFKNVNDNDVAVLEFATADQVSCAACVYEVSGNTITFKQIVQTSKTEEPFAYKEAGATFTYTFALNGPYLTFTKGEHSLQLKTFCLTENKPDKALSLHAYSLPESPLVGSLDYFACSEYWNYAVKSDGSYWDHCAYKIDDKGRFTMYLAEDDMVEGGFSEEVIEQYAYIIQSDAGDFGLDFNIILLDGEKIYYYTDDITRREARVLANQGVDVEGVSDETIKEIAEKKSDLYDDLQEEFEAQGINATVNRRNGEIALDSTVLFAVNESSLSADGKAFLQKFMDVYTSVVFSEKYDGFISKIMVEGHTDTDGNYDDNMTLSKARADSVKTYCLSKECGVDATYTSDLQTMLEAVGYSYDKPVYNDSGEVDKDASRRVSFCFIVNVQEQE